MTLSHRQRDRHHVVEELMPQVTSRTRISTQRADRLREFVLGHLPDGVTVDVIITPGVQTAAVLPANLDTILSSDATDLKRAQAEHPYLVSFARTLSDSMQRGRIRLCVF